MQYTTDLSPSASLTNGTHLQFAVCADEVLSPYLKPPKTVLYGRTREDFFSAYPRLLGVLPPPPSLGAPRHTPKNVASFVRQAKASLPEKSWDASVIMSRKALEAALKDKFDDLGDRLRLVDRIDEAAKQGYLTSDLAKWAQPHPALAEIPLHMMINRSRKKMQSSWSFSLIWSCYISTPCPAC